MNFKQKTYSRCRWCLLATCFVLANPNLLVQAEQTTSVSAEEKSPYSAEIPSGSLQLAKPGANGGLFDRLPESLADLEQIEEATTRLIENYRAATVGIQVGGGQGSGVVVSPQGHVLTAAHVVGEVGDRVTILFPDGRRHLAKVVGIDAGADAAIVRTEGKGPYPYVPMAQNEFAVPGRWVIAIGHPNGYAFNRLPVVRLGRVIQFASKTVQTDCSLVGGDSGGPLFDLQGRVVGVHSRIGASNTINLHVPVQYYLENWDVLNEGYVAEQMAEAEAPKKKAFLGISGRNAASSRGCMITEVSPGGPAQQGGLMRGDVLTAAAGQPIKQFSDLVAILKTKNPGDEVEFTLTRAGRRLSVTVILGDTEI